MINVMLNIYKISQSTNEGWGTYVSAVVCAENEEQARYIHPDPEETGSWWEKADRYIDWVKPELVAVELIGTTDILKAGEVVCSHNTGA